MRKSLVRGLRAFINLPFKSKFTILPLFLFFTLWVLELKALSKLKIRLTIYHPKLKNYTIFQFNPYKDVDTLLEEFLFGFYYYFYKPDLTHIVVDVGANIGDFCICLSKKVGKVYAFEPLSDAFAALKSNILLNNCKNIYSFNIALADYNGEAYLLEGRSSGGTRISYDIRGQRVRVAKLEDILGNIRRIDLLKIDVEGEGHKVLLGALKLLPRCIKIIVEIHTFEEESQAIKILRLFEFKVIIYKDPYGYPNFLIATNKQHER
jgi:FkbM family methyltransferase